jgi:hypothetical protein
MKSTQRRYLCITLLLLACLSGNPFSIVAHAAQDETGLEDWFNEDAAPAVPQAREGELIFLSTPPEAATLHSINAITVTRSSLDDGWVQVRQCYQGLDAVPAAEVVYQYRNMRALRIQSKSNIGDAFTRGQTVQLSDVQRDARLCVGLEAQILHPQSGGRFLLRTGPFHRRFLDGYFPLHVSMDLRFPAALLRYLGTSPLPRPGFELEVKDEQLHIDAWFAGKLQIEVNFSRRKSGGS